MISFMDDPTPRTEAIHSHTHTKVILESPHGVIFSFLFYSYSHVDVELLNVP